MLRNLWAIVAALVAAVSFGIATASAVEFGHADGNDHPWVGLAVFFDASGAPIQRCSGSLLSPTVFLTAGHCAGADAAIGAPAPSLARIWFAEGPIAFDPAYRGGSCNVGGPYTGYPCAGQNATGTPVAHPGWTGEQTTPQTSDVGVVRITSSSGLPTTYGHLAPLGVVDRLERKPSLTIVGYGAQDVKPALVSVPRRMAAGVQLVNTRSFNLREWGVEVSGSPGRGGAICYGDSGGPLLYDTGAGEVIVGVDSFVYGKNCTGTAAAYRVDTTYAQHFIADA
jgi:hypothetical protein